MWQFFTGKAQVINSFVTNNSSHCEKNVMKAAICLMTSCGDTGKNELDKMVIKIKIGCAVHMVQEVLVDYCLVM